MTDAQIKTHAEAIRDSQDRLERGLRLSLLIEAWLRDRTELVRLRRRTRLHAVGFICNGGDDAADR